MAPPLPKRSCAPHLRKKWRKSRNGTSGENLMSTTTGVKTGPGASVVDGAVTWKMWVPCLAMAACSWLSFFHRTMLAALAPTILKETGLDAQQFASVNAYFFVAYT